MSDIKRSLFEEELFALLGESFDDVKGIYLDRGTSLFETLAKIDAITASQPAIPGGTSIAGHVDHMRWYLEITEGYIGGKKYPGFDWKTTWQVKEVTDDEWTALVDSLRIACTRIIEFFKGFDEWDDDKKVGGAMGVLAHTAYHLGAIRQIVRAVAAS